MTDKQHLLCELRDLARGVNYADPASLAPNLMYAAADEIERLHATLKRITAVLALPADSEPDIIAAAVRQCTRRCEELEHKLLAFQEAHNYKPLDADDLKTVNEIVQNLSARVDALEAIHPLGHKGKL